jgi:hypothetical protein
MILLFSTKKAGKNLGKLISLYFQFSAEIKI